MMSTVISKNEQVIFQKATIIEPGVKMVGIINNRGRLVDSIGTDSIDMPKDKREMFFMKIALRNSMQQDFDEDLGCVDYCVTQRSSSKYISIPICDGNTILAVTKNDVDHQRVVNEINQMLQYSKQFLGIKISKEGEDSN